MGQQADAGISRRSFIAGASAAAAILGMGGTSLVGCSSGTGEGGEGLSETGPKEDKWIPTSCNMCFNQCCIKAHVVDGVVVELKGDENGPNQGRMCGKGASGIMQLYDPYRITKPMKRTNPEKGVDIDPGWEEITWEEAYQLAAEKIGAAVANRPNDFMWAHAVATAPAGEYIWYGAAGGWGTAEFMNSDLCGTGIHQFSDIYTTTGNSGPDYTYCKYLLQFGTQAGIATRHGYNTSCTRWANSRDEGAKMTVFDPHMSASAQKAERWVPIRPGTDTAAALAIANVLVHELDLLDYNYLLNHTNGPTLIDNETRRTIYDEATGHAIYMDASDNTIKPYDQCAQPTLEGEFDYNGRKATTAFSLYKEHIKQYTPEWQEEITTVPAQTIRDVAKEFGEAACIGETIEIDGATMDYRPACADLFSGVVHHKHCGQACMAIMTLNVLVGSCNQCGGFITFAAECQGFADGNDTVSWPTYIWEPDGLLDSHGMGSNARNSQYEAAYETEAVVTSGGFKELSPIASMDPHWKFISQVHPEMFNNAMPPSKVMFVLGCNPLRWWQNHDEQEALMKDLEYIIGCEIYLTDACALFDLIMPEACYLERFEPYPLTYYAYKGCGGMDVPWTLGIRQPVVPARDDCPSAIEIINELVDRSGSNEGYWQVLMMTKFLKPEYLDGYFDITQKLDLEKFSDAVYKSAIDDEHGLDWFKEHGVWTYPRKPEEMYIFANGRPGRVPIYNDCILEMKERARRGIEALGGFGFEFEFDEYTPMAEWKECCDHHIEDPDYDIFPIYWTDAMNIDTHSAYNVWIDEVNEQTPWLYAIEMNSETAKKKGLATGDTIVLTSREGVSVEGKLFVSETVHPEVASVVVGSLGSKSDHIPIAKGKGIGINHLIPGEDPKRFDHLTQAYDQCIRVKVTKK